MTKEIQKNIYEEEWYQNFIEECKSIIVEKATNARQELIEGFWLLGERILKEELNFEKAGYGEKKIELIARDLEKSPSYVYKSIQFGKKFKCLEEMWSKLPGGKSITLYKICNDILPEPNPERKKRELEAQIEKQKSCRHFNRKLKCVDCDKEFTDDDYDFNPKEKNE